MSGLFIYLDHDQRVGIVIKKANKEMFENSTKYGFYTETQKMKGPPTNPESEVILVPF